MSDTTYLVLDNGALLFEGFAEGDVALSVDSAGLLSATQNEVVYSSTISISDVKSVIVPDTITVSLTGDMELLPNEPLEGIANAGRAFRPVAVGDATYYFPATLTEVEEGSAFVLKNGTDALLSGALKPGFSIYTRASIDAITSQSLFEADTYDATPVKVYGFTTGTGNGADKLRLLNMAESSLAERLIGVTVASSTSGLSGVFLNKTFLDITLTITTDDEATKTVHFVDMVANDVEGAPPPGEYSQPETNAFIPLLADNLECVPPPAFGVELVDSTLTFTGNRTGDVTITLDAAGNIATAERQSLSADLSATTINIGDIHAVELAAGSVLISGSVELALNAEYTESGDPVYGQAFRAVDVTGTTLYFPASLDELSDSQVFVLKNGSDAFANSVVKPGFAIYTETSLRSITRQTTLEVDGVDATPSTVRGFTLGSNAGSDTLTLGGLASSQVEVLLSSVELRPSTSIYSSLFLAKTFLDIVLTIGDKTIVFVDAIADDVEGVPPVGVYEGDAAHSLMALVEPNVAYGEPVVVTALLEAGALSFGGTATQEVALTVSAEGFVSVERSGVSHTPDPAIHLATVTSIDADGYDVTLNGAYDLSTYDQGEASGVLTAGQTFRHVTVNASSFYLPAPLTEYNEPDVFVLKNGSDAFIAGDTAGSLKAGFSFYTPESIAAITRQTELLVDTLSPEHIVGHGITLGTGISADTITMDGVDDATRFVERILQIEVTPSYSPYSTVFEAKQFIDVEIEFRSGKTLSLVDLIATDAENVPAVGVYTAKAAIMQLVASLNDNLAYVPPELVWHEVTVRVPVSGEQNNQMTFELHDHGYAAIEEVEIQEVLDYPYEYPIEYPEQITPEQPLSASWHTLALNTDNKIEAWGRNNYSVIDVVPQDSTYKAVASGQFHALAVTHTGEIVGWGNDGLNQITNRPRGDGYVQVAAGNSHSMALDGDGKIVVWGDNTYDQIGDSPDEQETALMGFKAVAASYYQCLAIRRDGSLRAWGFDNTGHVTDAPTGSDFVRIACGELHSMALTVSGVIHAWGDDARGQVSQAPTGEGYIDIAAGSSFSAAINADGAIEVWGDLSFNRDVVPEGKFIKVVAGAEHFSALREDGRVVSWGRDDDNQVTNNPVHSNFLTVTDKDWEREIVPISLSMDGRPKSCFRAPVEMGGHKFVLLDIAANHLTVQVYEDWNPTTHVGSNLAYMSDSSAYAQRLRTSGPDTLYMFAHPRWLAFYSELSSSSLRSMCGCFEVEKLVESEVPGEFPLYAWIQGTIAYGALTEIVNTSNDIGSVYGFSYPRALNGSTGINAARTSHVGTVCARSLNSYAYRSIGCYYNYGNYSRRIYRTYNTTYDSPWDYFLDDLLPDGSNSFKDGANYAMPAYAVCHDPAFAYVRGRFFGFKLLGNGVGTDGDNIFIPCDEDYFYDSLSELQNHFVFTNTRGGRIALPL